MKPKYHIWIFLGAVFASIAAISIWGKWGALVTLTIFYIYSRYCYPIWCIFWNKQNKEIKKNQNEKYPKKMKYLDWKYENGKPVAKGIVEKELKESD